MTSTTTPFSGRTAIVTGAGSGLGRTHALLLAQLGAAVIVNDLGTSAQGVGTSASAADAVVQEIRDAGGQAAPSYDSVTTAAGGRAIVEAALDHFGGLDVLINNAGTVRNAPLDEMSDEIFAAMIDVHLNGAFYVTRPAFAAMKAKNYGRILFTASSAGLFGGERMTGYASGKAGLIGLMNITSIEGEPHNIRSNLLLPASTTRMADGAPPYMDRIHAVLEQLGETRNGTWDPAYVSSLAAYLVSEECQSTHAIYTAVLGRYARIFLGVGPGWIAPTGAPPTLEEMSAHFAEIEKMTPFTTPLHLAEEFEDLAKALGVKA